MHISKIALFSKNIPKLTKVQSRMDNDDILTIKELSLYLKLAEKTAYRLASDGKIPSFKVGGAWCFQKSEIDQWIKEQSNTKRDEKGTE